METQNTNAISNDRYRLGYHIMPKSGWINDQTAFPILMAIIISFTSIILMRLNGGQCIGDMRAVKI